MTIHVANSGPTLYTPLGVNKLEVNGDFSLAAWNTVAEHRLFTIGGGGLIEHSLFFVATGTAWASAGNLGTLDLGVTTAKTHFFAANTLPRGPWVIPLAGNAQFGYGVTGALGAGAAASGRSDRLGVNPVGAPYNIGYEIKVEAYTAGTFTAILFWRAITGVVTVTAGTGQTPI